MAVREVLVPNSLKDLLTHTCKWSDDKKQVIAVPFGSNCPNARHGCDFSNPPRNKFGTTHHSVVMTDGQISEFEKKWGEGKLRFPDLENTPAGAAAAEAASAKAKAKAAAAKAAALKAEAEAAEAEAQSKAATAAAAKAKAEAN